MRSRCSRPVQLCALAVCAAAVCYGRAVHLLFLSPQQGRDDGAVRHGTAAGTLSHGHTAYIYPVADPERCGQDATRGRSVLEWAAANGAAIHPHVRVSFVASGGAVELQERQIAAAGHIDRGEPLLSVPASLHMSLTALQVHRTLADVHASVEALDSSLFGLVFLLLSEASDVNSFWRPYLCSLPRRPPLPLLMDTEELGIARGRLPEHQRSTFDSLLTSQRHRVDAFCQKVVAGLVSQFPGRFRKSDYSQAHVKWAMAIIFSRAFPSKRNSSSSGDEDPDSWPGTGGIHALTPGADMPNHEAASLPMQQLLDDSVVLRASRRLRPGDPVTISYGRKCNAFFLAQYGFIPDGNAQVACRDDQTVRNSETFLSLFSRLDPILPQNATMSGK